MNPFIIIPLPVILVTGVYVLLSNSRSRVHRRKRPKLSHKQRQQTKMM